MFSPARSAMAMAGFLPGSLATPSERCSPRQYRDRGLPQLPLQGGDRTSRIEPERPAGRRVKDTRAAVITEAAGATCSSGRAVCALPSRNHSTLGSPPRLFVGFRDADDGSDETAEEGDGASGEEGDSLQPDADADSTA